MAGVIFEDEHLLVVNKPAGMNTHAPDPFAGAGLYDWLRHREPHWANLAIIHRLDKETSGVMLFGKTALANRSLTQQFAGRKVRKKYLLLTDRPMRRQELIVKSSLARAGDRYVSRAKGEPAETRFRAVASAGTIIPNRPKAELQTIQAEPLTGRTHQIRVHAAESGFPVLGDTLYGGSPFGRVCLHATELTVRHPATGEPMSFNVPPNFAADARLALRTALMDLEDTDAFRIVHGASDGWPDWYADRLGTFVLSQSEREPASAQLEYLKQLPGVTGVYHNILDRQVRRASVSAASPQLILGEAAPDRFMIRENGVRFEMSFKEGYSAGLFLDQRDNRRRFLTGHIAADFPLFDPELKPRNPKPEILNAFAYTCGFSICAAIAGARTTSLDLSKKYLEWGRRNFALNGIDAGDHDFIYGDVFDWLRRLAKKGRLFDAVALDPPTFSQSKEFGVFRAEKDYGRLIRLTLPLLRGGGVLFASTNAAGWLPAEFLKGIEATAGAAGRKSVRQHYVPQPPDFPVTRPEPAYLKTVWLRVV